MGPFGRNATIVQHKFLWLMMGTEIVPVTPFIYLNGFRGRTYL